MSEVTTITLTPAEVAFVVSLGAQRHVSKTTHATKNEYEKSLTNFGAHCLGALGEFAVSKHYRAKISQEILPNGDKHRPDLVTNVGTQLEIKTTDWGGKDPMLKLDEKEALPNRFYVLVVVKWPDVALLYPPVTLEQILQYGDPKPHNFGYGPRKVITGDQILKATA